MSRLITIIALATALAVTSSAQQPEPNPVEGNAAANSEASRVPAGLQGFRGMLLGRLVSRDLELGEFSATIDYVPRIWRNNTARQPRAAVGKTFVVEGVTGKWLDQLLLIEPGETFEFEAQHIRGDRLRFPGELLRKVPPYDPKDYPTPPDEFRGFHGVVVGRIEKKLDTGLELILKVLRIEESADDNQAKQAAAVVGKPVVVAGFWQASFREKFDDVRAGDVVRAGLRHIVPQSDHYSVMDTFEKVASDDVSAQSDEPGQQAER